MSRPRLKAFLLGLSESGRRQVDWRRFSELLRHLPKNTGMSFVFVQHLDPKNTSRLTDILSRITDMPVEVAIEGRRMQRDRVYVMPPGLDLTVSDGILKLEPRTDTGGLPFAIHYFFCSLAR